MTDPTPEILVRGTVSGPRVSVIVPMYNAGGSLVTAVRSALEQALRELEVIIVDDRSTDDSVEIAKQLAQNDSRISLLRLPRNLGPATARNAAIDLARGVWIAPLDADDEMARHRLMELCRLGEARAADLVADKVAFVDPDEREPLKKPANARRGVKSLSLRAVIESDIPLNGQCSFGFLKPLMRREYLLQHEIRYDTDLRFAEDFNLYARAMIHGARFLLCTDAYYRYNQTPVSASRDIGGLPRTADHALINNQRLHRIVRERGLDDIDRLLVEHGKRWRMVLWLNRLRLAMRQRRAGELLRLGFTIPSGPRALVRFARDRKRMALATPAPTDTVVDLPRSLSSNET